MIHGYLEKIDASSQHLLALINDILEMSRIESGKTELEYVPVDLCALFDGMRDLFSERKKRRSRKSTSPGSVCCWWRIIWSTGKLRR